MRGIIRFLILINFLVNRGAGKDVEGIGVGWLDAGFDFEIAGGGDHGGVVAGKRWGGEKDI